MREQGLIFWTVAAARLWSCLATRLRVVRAFLGGRRKDLPSQRLELRPQEIELELGGDAFTPKLGDFDLQLGDGLLLGDDGLFEEKGGLLEGVNVADLLQPWHEEWSQSRSLVSSTSGRALQAKPGLFRPATTPPGTAAAPSG